MSSEPEGFVPVIARPLRAEGRPLGRLPATTAILLSLIVSTGCDSRPPSPGVPLLDEEHRDEVLVESPTVSLRPTWNRSRFLSGWWPAGENGPLTLVTGNGMTAALEVVLLDRRERRLALDLAPGFGLPESVEVRIAGERPVSMPAADPLLVPVPENLPPGPVLVELTPRGGRLAVVGARLRPAFEDGEVVVDAQGVRQRGPSILDIVRPAVDQVELSGRFEPPSDPGTGQTFSVVVEGQVDGPRTVFRWKASDLRSRLPFGRTRRFETRLDLPRPNDGPGFVRIRLQASGDGPPGRWSDLSLAASGYPQAPAPASESSVELPEAPSLVLLYVMDALRSDTAWQGETIQRLAREGRAFEEHRSTAPNTLPATKALLTGVPSVRCGGCRLPADGPRTLAETFREAGYATSLISGNVYVGPAYGVDRGFDHVVEIPPPTDPELEKPGAYNDSAERLHAAALDWLDGLDPDRPAFLYVHVMHPHNPYAPPAALERQMTEGIPSEIDGGTPTLLAVQNRRREIDEPDRLRLRRLYEGGFRYADRELGRFLDELAERRPIDQQLVAFTADHGEELFEHGGILHGYTLYEEMIRIPLVLWAPGRIPPETASAGGSWLSDPLDLHATLSTLAGASARSGEGGSLWPWILGSDSRSEAGPSDPHFAAAASVRGGIFSAQTPRWKLVYAPRIGKSWGQGSRLGRNFDPLYLFDLRSDPGERENRIGRESLEADWLRARLKAWVEGHWGAEGEGGDEPGDAETLRRLRALGYVE